MTPSPSHYKLQLGNIILLVVQRDPYFLFFPHEYFWLVRCLLPSLEHFQNVSYLIIIHANIFSHVDECNFLLCDLLKALLFQHQGVQTESAKQCSFFHKLALSSLVIFFPHCCQN